MSPPAGAQLPSEEPHLPPGSYPQDAPGEPYLSTAQVEQKAKRHAEFNVEVEKLRPTFFATVPKEDHVYLENWLANPGRMWRFANGHPTPKAAAEAMRGAIAKRTQWDAWGLLDKDWGRALDYGMIRGGFYSRGFSSCPRTSTSDEDEARGLPPTTTSSSTPAASDDPSQLHRTFRANCPFVHYRMRDDDGSIPVVYRIKFCICNLDALEDWWDTVDAGKPYHQQGRWMCFFDCNTAKPSAVQIDVADDLFAADERMSFAAFAVEMGRVANLLYPERMHKAVIIDAGYLATAAYYIVSRFLTQKTRNNVCFVMRGSGNSYFHHAGASGKTTSGSVALGQALAEKRRRKRNNHIDDALDEVVGEQDRLRQLIEGRKLAPWESTFRAFSGTKELEVEYGGDNAFVFNPHVPPHEAHPFIYAAFRRRGRELDFFPDLAACGDEDGNVDVARLRRGVSAFHQQRGEGAQRGESAQERGGHDAAVVLPPHNAATPATACAGTKTGTSIPAVEHQQSGAICSFAAAPQHERDAGEDESSREENAKKASKVSSPEFVSAREVLGSPTEQVDAAETDREVEGVGDPDKVLLLVEHFVSAKEKKFVAGQVELHSVVDEVDEGKRGRKRKKALCCFAL